MGGDRNGKMRRSIATAVFYALTGCGGRPANVTPAPRRLLSRSAAAWCLDSIPITQTTPETVYVHAVVLDSTARDLVPLAADLARRVAERTRVLLHGSAERVPPAEPAIGWRTPLDGNLAAVLQRDGRVFWRIVPPDSLRDTVALALLARATEEVAGPAQPTGSIPPSTPDHLGIRLLLGRHTWSYRLAVGPRQPLASVLALVFRADSALRYRSAAGPGFAAFTVRRPSDQRPELLSVIPPAYPTEYRRQGVSARVLMEMIVGPDGRVEPSSIRMVSFHQTGDDLGAQAAFGRALTASLLTARYRPGMIGGCAVRVRVQQPVNFEAGPPS